MKTYNKEQIKESLLHWMAQGTLHDSHWYRFAKTDVIKMANQFDVPINIAAGVVAILSPRNQWNYNLSDALTLLSAWKLNLDPSMIRVHTFDSHKWKAWSLLNDQTNYLHYIKGDKVVAFWNTLCHPNDIEVAVIDTWMLIAAGLTKSDKLDRNGLYKLMSDCVQDIAVVFGVPTCEAQARIWCAVRRYHGYKDTY